mgnify:CR=1 FL=1
MTSETGKRTKERSAASGSFKFGGIDIDVLELASRGNAVLGIRDSGKTYTATALAEKLMSNGVPIIVFDPVGVWRFLRVPGAGKGYPVVVAGGMAGDLPLTVKDAPDIVRAAMKAGVSLVIDLFSKEFSKSNWKAIVAACVEVLIYENQEFGLRHVIIEEAAEFVPQRVDRGNAVGYSAMEKLARVGGNSRLGYTLINQRPEEVNKAVLELCDNLFLHRQKGRNTLKSLSKWLDMGNVEQIKPIMETMSALPSGECWVWLKDHDEVKRIKVPKKTSMHPDRRVMHGGAKAIANKAVDVGTFVANMKKILEKPAKAAAKPVAAPTVKGGKAPSLNPRGYTLANVETAYQRGITHGTQGSNVAIKSLRAALDSAMKFILKVRVEGFDADKEMMKGAIETAMKSVKDRVNGHIAKREKDFDKLRQDGTKIVQAIEKLLNDNVTAEVVVSRNEPFSVTAPPMRINTDTRPAVTVSEMQGGDETLTGPQRAMLRALAWWLHMGKQAPSRVQVAVICKWKTTGSNIKDRISELFRLGLISKPTSETVALTEAGAKAAPAPDLSQSLVESVRAILKGPQDALFMQLPADGSEITRAAICDALGWNPDGSNIKDRISELFRLEVIVKPSSETVARADWITE